MSCSADILEELVDDVIPTIGGEVAGCHTHKSGQFSAFLLKSHPLRVGGLHLGLECRLPMTSADRVL